MSKIQLIPLDQTTIQLIDGDRGVNYPNKKDFSSDGYCLFLDSSNLTKNGFDFSSKVFINQEKDISMGKGKIQNGDLVMNTRGTLGNIGYYTTDIPYKNMRINSGMLIIRGGNQYDQSFLYGFFRSKLFFSQVENIMSGSVQKQLPIWIFNFIKVPKLDIPSQKKIASVLSTLDAKIELNNKINTELETMAKTLYDYWFVQFDFPDENEKPYKSSGGEMVWSEELKRDIPKGWEVKELGKFCEIYQPQTISEKEMLDDGKYYVFGANGVVGKYDQYNHENSEIVITCRGNTCGNITRTYPYSWITGNAMVVKPKDEKIHNEFVFCLLQNINIHKTITGSAQPQITRTNLSPVKILLPDENLLKKFSEQIESNVKKRLQIVEENQKLAELRDFLLPMLMNGQVVVK